jgi:hypothetical protein
MSREYSKEKRRGKKQRVKRRVYSVHKVHGLLNSLQVQRGDRFSCLIY